MFDHLEPKVQKPVALHHHISLFFMMASALTLTTIFALPIISFTQTIRPEQPIQQSQVSLWLDSHFEQAQSIVVPQTDFELAQYTMEVADQPAKLSSLHFTVDGVGELNRLEPVRLYIDKVQVGTGQIVSDRGDLDFQLASILPAGVHTLELRSGWQSEAQGQIVAVSIESTKDIILTQKDQIVGIKSILPVTTAPLTLSDKGSLMAVNSPTVHIAAAASSSQSQQADVIYKLNATGEPIDISKLSFVAGTNNFALSEIQLMAGNQVVKSWTRDTDIKNRIDFIVPIGTLKVSPGSVTELHFRLLGRVQENNAEAQIRLYSLAGLGFISGQEIKWLSSQPLLKSQIFKHDQLTWSLGDSASSYQLVMKSESGQPVTIYQMTVQLTPDQTSVPDAWKVTVDGVAVPTEIPLIQATKFILRFPSGIKISSGQRVDISPISKVKGSASIRLVADQIDWSSNSVDWYAHADDGTLAIPATHISW